MNYEEFESQLDEANITREEGKFAESLARLAELKAAVSEETVVLLPDVLSCEFIAYKHLYRQSSLRQHYDLGLDAASMALKVATDIDDPNEMMIAAFNLGKAYELDNEWQSASEAFEQSLRMFGRMESDSRHNRPAVQADIQSHLARSLYHLGQTDKAKEIFAVTIDVLKADTVEDSYTRNVWLSGSYMRAAEVLWTAEPELASDYLKEAEKIIKTDERLGLRMEQLEELKTKMAE